MKMVSAGETNSIGSSEPPIEPITPGDLTDDAGEFEPSEFDTESVGWQSVTSGVYKHYYENGRRYHTYRYGRYPIPNDDEEQDREDMKHAMHMELTSGKLFYAPVLSNPHKIIDLGTGTGMWAMDMADKFPSAEVIGTDLSPIQSTWVPPNLRFVVDDCEDEWTYGSDFDFVHLRSVSCMLKDLPKLLRQAIDHMRPGAWFESQDFCGQILSDDDSLGDSTLPDMWKMFAESLATYGMKYWFVANEDFGPLLEAAGFVNISVKTIKVPIGTWPKDKTLRLCGLYMNMNMTDFIKAMANKPLRQGMNPEEAESTAARAIKDLNRPSVHAYIKYKFWMGQKPPKTHD